jgi:hypothetical protein
MEQCTRRKFMEKAILGAGGIIAVGHPVFSENSAEKNVFVPKMTVNPAIDNLRVVCGVNKAMITRQPASWDMAGQNGPVDSAQVERTLDAVAIALTRKGTAPEAWKTIFRKPESKTWDGVKAAIKVNGLGKNHPRLAVVNKICMELNKIGVQCQNMYVYDGSPNAGPLYSPFVGKGLPGGVIISDKDKALGGTMKMAILEKGAYHSYECTRMIADGSIDILVNIAVNKGHDKDLGGTTLTLKNHAGTFEPLRIHMGGGLDYIIGFSKSNAVWGGNPVRQQLCIVYSIWGSTSGGPFVVPDKRLDCLIMGTFSGAVDYLIAKKIREPLMGAKHGPIDRFIKDFGYEENEMTRWETITA